jgi:hypothetical protein
MTRRDTLKCVHEPFGDAFYYGPERLSTRFANDEQARVKTGFHNSTYQTIFDRIDREGNEVRFFPPRAKPLSCLPLAIDFFPFSFYLYTTIPLAIPFE